MYKVGLSLEIENERVKDEFLKRLRNLLMDYRMLEGKITVKHEVKLDEGYVDLFALGVKEEPLPDTPMDTFLKRVSVPPSA